MNRYFLCRLGEMKGNYIYTSSKYGVLIFALQFSHFISLQFTGKFLSSNGLGSKKTDGTFFLLESNQLTWIWGRPITKVNKQNLVNMFPSRLVLCLAQLAYHMLSFDFLLSQVEMPGFCRMGTIVYCYPSTPTAPTYCFCVELISSILCQKNHMMFTPGFKNWKNTGLLK